MSTLALTLVMSEVFSFAQFSSLVIPVFVYNLHCKASTLNSVAGREVLQLPLLACRITKIPRRSDVERTPPSSCFWWF